MNKDASKSSTKSGLGKSDTAPVSVPGPAPNIAVNKKSKLSDFEIKRTLGTGSFGRVHLVRHKDSGKWFAMKVLKKSEVVKLKQVEHTLNEKHILDIIDFPFLVKMVASFQDSVNLFMVLEYVVGGELFTYLRKAQVR